MKERQVETAEQSAGKSEVDGVGPVGARRRGAVQRRKRILVPAQVGGVEVDSSEEALAQGGAQLALATDLPGKEGRRDAASGFDGESGGGTRRILGAGADDVRVHRAPWPFAEATDFSRKLRSDLKPVAAAPAETKSGA